LKVLNNIGEFGYLLSRVVLSLKFIVKDKRRLIYQLDHIGVKSVPLVLLVGFFAGAIIAWQGAYQMKGMISLDMLGGQAARVVVVEMSPVLTALVIAGRIGASMTAEIGTMKISEQVDALKTMAIDPVRYIVLPRFAGLSIMMPVLGMFANLAGVVGAFFVANYFLDVTWQTFFDSIRGFFELRDLTGGLLKTAIFGISISLIACFMGFSAEGGAEGVGKATITSFVMSAVFILLGDFCLWLILF